MADTTNYGWTKPEVGGDNGAWGGKLNTVIDDIDAKVHDVDTVAAAALPKAGGALTGRLDAQTSTEAFEDLGARAGAVELDLATANVFSLFMSGDVDLSIKAGSVPASGASVLFLRVSNGGSYTLNWPASFKFPVGGDTTITASGIDVFGFITLDGGAKWLFCGAAKNLPN